MGFCEPSPLWEKAISPAICNGYILSTQSNLRKYQGYGGKQQKPDSGALQTLVVCANDWNWDLPAFLAICISIPPESIPEQTRCLSLAVLPPLLSVDSARVNRSHLAHDLRRDCDMPFSSWQLKAPHGRVNCLAAFLQIKSAKIEHLRLDRPALEVM